MGVPAIDLNTDPQRFRELVREASRKGEVVLTHDGQAVAKITPLHPTRAPRRPGSARGLIHMAEDFDTMPEELRDFF